MFARLFRSRSGRSLVDHVHANIVAAVRQPALYAQFGAPDTFDGRFEMLVLHAWAVIRRLEQLPAPGPAMAQELTDAMFQHLDIALREMGVSDIGVPKRMKKLASAYFGRATAYGQALALGDEEFTVSLARNAYGAASLDDAPSARALARYIHAVEAQLAETPAAALLQGTVSFPVADRFAENRP